MFEITVICLINLLFFVGLFMKKTFIKIIFFGLHIGYFLYWYILSAKETDGWALLFYGLILSIIGIFICIHFSILITILIIKRIKNKQNRLPA